MRLRTWFLAAVLVACGSFSASEEEPTADGGTDAGAGDGAISGDAGTDSSIQELDAAADVFSIGPAANAPCDASRRCIDFETPLQRSTPFGFDTTQPEVDGGMTIHDAGFGSSFGLSLEALDDNYSRGQITLDPVPPALRVRMKVRSDSRDSGATSDHFLMLSCENGGDNLSAKLSLGGELAVQAGSAGKPIGAYTDGTWIAVDALAVFGGGMRQLTLKRLDTNAQNTVSTPEPCDAPLTIRVQSSLTGSNVGRFTLSVDDIGIDWN